MLPEPASPREPCQPRQPGTPQLLVETQCLESQCRVPHGTASRFLRAARHLAASGRPVIVFLIDDGVRSAVGPQPGVTGILTAGGQVWADRESLADRAIPATQLTPGVVEAALDKVAPLLFDPAVQVVWH